MSVEQSFQPVVPEQEGGAQKQKALEELEPMLRDLDELRFEGDSGEHFDRARKYIDAYMQELQDKGIATHAELLQYIQDRRAKGRNN